MSVEEVSWGELLRERRSALGWSLADLADRTGLSRAYISALERGRSKRPGANTMRRLEEAVGQLFDIGSGQPEAPPGLSEFARERGLSNSDVEALSSLRVRGRAPQTKERWEFIYQALLASESFDDEGAYTARKSRRKPPSA